jgi:ketosteroid isomerase-like protein
VKKLVLVTLIAGLTTAGLYAGQAASADRAAVEKSLAALEQKINDAFIKRDVATMKANITDDAVAIDGMGPSAVTELFKQLPTMDIKVTDMKLSDFKYLWVDASNVLVTYTFSAKGTVMGQPVPSPTYAASLYTKRNGKWLALFHQETAAMPAPPAAKPAAAAPKPATAPAKK